MHPDRATTAQGWYLDPFDVHERRWFSDGRPTDLVRDGAVEAHDAPPAETWDGELVEPAEVVEADGEDLLRADEAATAAPYDARQATDAALDAGAAGGIGFG